MAGSAINEIMQMRQQGLSNNQIIQNLQRAGFTNTQIFDAMNQADTKMAVEGYQPSFQQTFTQPPVQEPQPATMFTQPPPEASAPPERSHHADAFNQEKVEELVEAIVEEKWTELVKDINKIVDWKNRVESRISDMEIKVDALKENLSDLNRAIISKVNDYDKHILEVGSDVKAMEKVFSKVLPAFTENVNELSRIANKLKEK